MIVALALGCGGSPNPPAEPSLSSSSGDETSSESKREAQEEVVPLAVLHEIELGEVAILQFLGERVPPGMTPTYGVTEVWVEFAEPEARRPQLPLWRTFHHC